MARPPPRSPDAVPWGWAGAGAVLGLLLALLLYAPARWLAAGLARASNGQVQLAEPRGTVWSGSARLLLTGGAGSRDAAALPDRLEWRLRPASSGLTLRLLARCCMAEAWRLALTPHWSGLRLRLADAHARWPAALLQGLGTPWNTVRPEGELALSTERLEIDWNAGRLTVSGGARLDANDIASRLSTLRPMGSYRVTLRGGAVPALQLETLPGSNLQLSGSGQWVGSRLRFEGSASAAPERVDALSNLLNILGRRDGTRSIIKVG